MINFDYARPSSQAAALTALGKEVRAKFIAGGTNLVDLMKRGVETPEKLIDITALPLKGIEQKAGFIRIGALALNSEVAENELVNQKLPLLAMALKAGASPQIRNMATVGGNMMQRTRCPYFYDINMPCNKRKPGTGCAALKGYNRMHAILGASENCIAVHPSDMCVALTALGANVIVAGTKDERRIPFIDFHRLPGTTPEKDNNLQKGELIVAVEVPDNQKGMAHYLKIRDRASYAFALVSVAVMLPLSGSGASAQMKGVKMALGGVAHKPWRATWAEKFLQDKKPSVEVFEAAANGLLKEAKGYGHNNFKLKLAHNAIVQALSEAVQLNKEGNG